MKHLICALLVQDTSSWPLIEPLPSYGRGRELPGGRYISLIHGSGLQDVVITGSCFAATLSSHIKLLQGKKSLFVPHNGIPSYKIKSSVKLLMVMIVCDGNCNVFR